MQAPPQSPLPSPSESSRPIGFPWSKTLGCLCLFPILFIFLVPLVFSGAIEVVAGAASKLTFGWIQFILGTLRRAHWDWGMILGGILSLGIAALILHAIARNVSKRMGGHWGLRGTAFVAGGIVLLFCSAVAMNGIIQITRWELEDGVSSSHNVRKYDSDADERQLSLKLRSLDENGSYFTLDDVQQHLDEAVPNSTWIAVAPLPDQVLLLQAFKLAHSYRQLPNGQYRIMYWDASVRQVPEDELEERLWFPKATLMADSYVEPTPKPKPNH